jgi:hypothetical protein
MTRVSMIAEISGAFAIHANHRGTARTVNSSGLSRVQRSRHSSAAGLLLFPERHANPRIIDRGFPIVRFGEGPDKLAALVPRQFFAWPNTIQVILERHAEFLRLEPVTIEQDFSS